MIRDLKRRSGRERRGLALAEGVRLVEEALAAGVPIRGAVVSPALEATRRGEALKGALVAAGVKLETVDDRALGELADTEHPQGVVAVIEPREWFLDDIALEPRSAVLVLDAVQDPGNVGTMLRTALALGAAGVVALPGTADLSNPKVIRGSMGALLPAPLRRDRCGHPEHLGRESRGRCLGHRRPTASPSPAVPAPRRSCSCSAMRAPEWATP